MSQVEDSPFAKKSSFAELMSLPLPLAESKTGSITIQLVIYPVKAANSMSSHHYETILWLRVDGGYASSNLISECQRRSQRSFDCEHG